MALESVVFQQDPYSNYIYKDLGFSFEEEKVVCDETLDKNMCWDYSSGTLYSMVQNMKEWDIDCFSPDNSIAGDGFLPGSCGLSAETPASASGRRKRRRSARGVKNNEDMETQRMTHIAVERNRRRQMNDYLAVLRSLMPPSYAQRGDQASIVGGAINYVKELEQLLQSLEANKQTKQLPSKSPKEFSLFANFFTFPQYSTRPSRRSNSPAGTNMSPENKPDVADIEVTMVENHATIKVLSRRSKKQLLKMVNGFHFIFLTILHLNITTVDHMVLYSFTVKVEDDCELTSVSEIATAVHKMVGLIQEETISSLS